MSSFAANNKGALEEMYGEDDHSSVAISEREDVVNQDEDLKKEMKKLGQAENRAVLTLRILVLCVIIITGALVSVGVYMYAKNDQIEDMEHDFASYGDKVIESFQEAISRKLEAIDALSVTYTSHALATGATFPNVTLPDFEIRGMNARILADCAVINYYPLVTDETRQGWEAYANASQGHFEVALASDLGMIAAQDAELGVDKDGGRKLETDFSRYREHIESFKPDGSGEAEYAPEGSGPFLPVWQVTPMVPMKFLLNFNVLSHPSAKAAYQRVIASGNAVMDFAANLEGENLGDSGAYFQLLLSLSQYRHEFNMFIGDPTTALGYPVFDSFGPDRKIAGMLATNLYWRVYFENVLPEDAKGIICVLTNTHNQTFSYRIDGKATTFLGAGDHHDPKYDYLEVSEDVTQYLQRRASARNKGYTSVKLDTEYISYTLHVYPSQDTEDSYSNNEPVIFTVVVALVFGFSILVFATYDLFVARRQRIVMQRALASGAIVSSLFPTKVREQLYEENEEKNKANTFKQLGGGVGAKNVDTFLRSSNMGNELVQNSAPIASLYKNCTVLFADLAGFTNWSANRSPEHVFELLETIYGAFDRIALRRGVFKIETIGDCYVAVTGVPDSNPKHSIVMVKFARDCIAKFNELKRHELAERLGADTATLEFRVGLHSGDVTAGVLRGQKARFQLFGDTVNTAARMESNGKPGKIHASQATADSLIALGKSDWVTPRGDQIFAKGKGVLQTYFVTVKANGSAGTRSMRSATTRSEMSSSRPGDEDDDLSPVEELDSGLKTLESYYKTVEN